MHVTEPVRATIPVQNGARLSWDRSITKAPVIVLSSCQGTIIAVRSVAQIGETIFVDNSLQKTQLLRSEPILFIDILAGFTCC